jgi:hypothetical protein
VGANIEVNAFKGKIERGPVHFRKDSIAHQLETEVES